MKIFPNKEVSLGTEDRNIIIGWSRANETQNGNQGIHRVTKA